MHRSNHAVRFILDDEVFTLPNPDPNRTLLQFLREDICRTGTREGCAEGDCGACTVLLGAACETGRIHYRSVNACLRFLPTVDGMSVVTVESLSRTHEQLHPVQQAMVDAHASQCGFCTPGFVMSLFDLYLNHPDAQRSDVIRAISGNLCRCTGYRPIIEAGCRMQQYPEPRRWSRADAESDARHEQMKAIERHECLELIQDKRFRSPRHLEELAGLYASDPEAVILAGGTDVGIGVNNQFKTLNSIIYIGEVRELQQIEKQEDGSLNIGAAVCMEDALSALTEVYPSLKELHQRFASPPIRHSATLAGNIANGSPVGDSIPVLLALGASLWLNRDSQRRLMALGDFYHGYHQTTLEKGEFIEAVHIPASESCAMVAAYKVSKRTAQDISAVCCGFRVVLDSNRHIGTVRLAYGGLAAFPKRARTMEATLDSMPWSLDAIKRASAMLEQDFTPMTDMRATSDYRLVVARNLLMRFFLEHSHMHVPVRLPIMTT